MAVELSEATVPAAGGVLWRPVGASLIRTWPHRPNPTEATSAAGPDGIEIAVVHRPKYDDWSLPKGKLNHGEHALMGACREVIEETGMRPMVGPRLPSTGYTVMTARGPAPKNVDYWAMRALGGEFLPNPEVDQLAWLPPDKTVARLTHQHDEVVVNTFTALPGVTGTVLLVRHAHAGDRKSWKGDDRKRPIDELGEEQAHGIAQVLPWFAPDRIMAVDKVRCEQTVAPLADVLGMQVDVVKAFAEERHGRAPRRTAAQVRGFATLGGVTVVCSQGGVIPDVVDRLAAQDKLSLEGISSRKGSVWALSFHDQTLVAADYFPSLIP